MSDNAENLGGEEFGNLFGGEVVNVDELVRVAHSRLRPIPTEPLFITGKQLKQFNAESIRLGFSRNLWPKKIGRKIPDDMIIPICQAFHHTSSTDNPPLRNIRLVFSLPKFVPTNWRQRIKKVTRSLATVFLDVTPDAWAVIRAQLGERYFPS
jgi:hypothetical protein